MDYPGAARLRNHDIEHNDALQAAGEFYLVGDVDDKVCLKLAQAMLRVGAGWPQGVQRPTFVLHINSGGGDVQAGLMLGATIQRLRSELGICTTTYVAGAAMSMGLTIAQYGAWRLVDVAAIVHTHDIKSAAFGTIRHQRAYLAARAKTQWLVARVFALRNTAGHNDPDKWIKDYLNGGEYFWTADEAVQMGLFDRVAGSFPSGLA